MEQRTCSEYSPTRNRIKLTEQRMKDQGRTGTSPIQKFKSSAAISLGVGESWIRLQGDQHLDS